MTEYTPVERAVTVPLPVEEAFQLFTSGIGTWWPLETHSMGEETPTDARFEGRIGGRVYEIAPDGSEADWGEVLEWDPPRHFAMSWLVHRTGAKTEWAADFEPDSGGTRVTVVHTGWENLGVEAAETRAGYDTGWEYVLGHYEKVAG